MRKYLAGAVALTASVALLASTPAVAGGPTDPNGDEVSLGVAGGLKYLSEDHNVGDGGTHSPPYDATDIACGPHVDSPWHVVSGGGTVKAPPSQTLLAVMRPMDLDGSFESPDNAAPDDWWETVVKSVIGDNLTGYAICSKKSNHYVIHETPTSTSAARVDTATCPAGDEVVGGGTFIATTNSFINSSYPLQGRWKSRVNDTVGGAGGMETFAICRPNARVDSQIVATEHANVLAGSAGSVSATCSTGRHAIGGGGKLTGPIGEAWLSASRPIDNASDVDTVPDDGWRVVGYNASGTIKSVWAFAICVTNG
jgi:hypothetical protein